MHKAHCANCLINLACVYLCAFYCIFCINMRVLLIIIVGKAALNRIAVRQCGSASRCAGLRHCAKSNDNTLIGCALRDVVKPDQLTRCALRDPRIATI